MYNYNILKQHKMFNDPGKFEVLSSLNYRELDFHKDLLFVPLQKPVTIYDADICIIHV